MKICFQKQNILYILVLILTLIFTSCSFSENPEYDSQTSDSETTTEFYHAMMLCKNALFKFNKANERRELMSKNRFSYPPVRLEYQYHFDIQVVSGSCKLVMIDKNSNEETL